MMVLVHKKLGTVHLLRPDGRSWCGKGLNHPGDYDRRNEKPSEPGLPCQRCTSLARARP
jgi:hypothetical protein